MAINIPEEGQKWLNKLSDLDDDVFNELLSTLKNLQPQINIFYLAKKISSEHLSPNVIYNMIATISGLYLYAERKKLDKEDLVQEACEVISVEPSSKSKLKSRLFEILSIDSLGITTKACDVMTNHDNCFCNARVLTDIRPVFKPTIEDGPSAAVITHLLQIAYHKGHPDNQHKSIRIALDSSDIDEMIKVLQRAQKKESSIKNKGILSIPIIEVDDEEI
jgi:hypothetical protein